MIFEIRIVSKSGEVFTRYVCDEHRDGLRQQHGARVVSIKYISNKRCQPCTRVSASSPIGTLTR